MNRRAPILAALLLAALAACSPSADEEPPPAAPAGEVGLALSFERQDDPGLDPFTVTVTLTRGGRPAPGETVTAEAPRGTASPVADHGDGTYSFSVTPDDTGEHPVTVRAAGRSVQRTALVLRDVHSDWGQPMEVPGLVNTAGYEDGVTVSPDGSWLFVQTGPFHWSGLIVFLTPRDQGGAGGHRLLPTEFHHPWMDELVGTYTAPRRPGFFDGRFDGMRFLHNARSWGVGENQAPNWGMSTMLYGFRRLDDGRFGDPFYIAFDDAGDAIVTPYGLAVRPVSGGDGRARIVFSLDMPAAEDEPWVDVAGDGFGGPDDARSGIDLYTAEITLGANNILGTFAPTGTPGTPPRKTAPFSAVPVALGNTGTAGIFGTQGNVSWFEDDDAVLLFTDDEYDAGGDRGDIAAYELASGAFPAGSWTKVLLPAPVNTADDEIQPFFTGKGLFFTRSSGPEVWYAAYAGPPTAQGLAAPAHWSAPVKILHKDTVPAVGRIIALGEPTRCVRRGRETLYFLYGVVRAIDDAAPATFYDIDMNAGFVHRR